ncbi:hypothetical protein O181_076299 [Austropuccinia psidii MF-1]|uniref:Integrase catalytic domain-containing protein n=1 Tax=Austropuccinia psidii MF-1 TaxID=1389203 RepID=A0A9Q3FCP1_9BASI|nr:hypothetical protein [Austropuccinia psidii MF-1]
MPPFLTKHLNLLRAYDRNKGGKLHGTGGSSIMIMRGKLVETQGNVQESSCDILYSLHSLFGHIGLKQLKQIVQQCFGNTAAINLPRKMANCAHCSVMKSRLTEWWEICPDNQGHWVYLRSWCINRGTMHEKSLPYNHEQNGAIEQYNQSITDMGRTLLKSSGLPTAFWGFAFMWAEHVQNNIPNRKTGDRTPKELLFGEQPFYKELRIFGEKAFIYMPKEKRQKLDDPAVKGRVVMFCPNNKGCLFFIPATNPLTSSIWAKFPNSADVVRTIQQWTIKNPYKVRSQDNLANQLSTTTATIPVPKTYKQAMNSPDSAQWSTAIEEELRNMNNIAPLPTGQHVFGGGWVFVKKAATQSLTTRFKAGYVARGNRQAESKFKLTFAPKATFTLLQMLLTIVGLHKWYINSFDFVTAYLKADIKEDIWVRPPDGLAVPPRFECKLWKALYGTKQAGNCWWNCVAGRLQHLGYRARDFDKILYIHQLNKGIIWLHVDDGIVATEDPKGCESIIGVDIAEVDGGFHLNQGHVIQSIINTTWHGTPATKTPLPAKCNLTTLGKNKKVELQKEFIGAVGALSYIEVGTQPDIAYSVNLLAQHTACPGLTHRQCLQHLLGYMARTTNTCLTLRLQGHRPCLEVFSDASWGGELSRSTHGYVVQLNGCTISWCAKRLVMVAASSCHAEFMVLGLAARHSRWAANLFEDITGVSDPFHLLCDNTSAIKIGEDCSSNKRTMDSDREFFITIQLLQNRTALLKWVATGNMYADIMKKPLGLVLNQQLSRKVLHGG